MAASVTLSVDGRKLEVAPGATLREACREASVEIPTLCFNPNFSPANACRLCVVEVVGARTLVPACSRVVEPGMRILTGSQREFCRSWPNQTEVTVGGSHFIQEDSAPEIGRAIADWAKQHVMLGGAV